MIANDWMKYVSESEATRRGDVLKAKSEFISIPLGPEWRAPVVFPRCTLDILFSKKIKKKKKNSLRYLLIGISARFFPV